MAGRAVHFSLADDEVAAFRDRDRQARGAHLSNVVEPDYFQNHRERIAESDKAWDAIHRVLANGLLEYEGGEYPLTHVILGGENLGDDEELLILKTPRQVHDAAATLPGITREWFRARYDAIDDEDYEFELGDEDFDYVWDWFEGVRTFWLHAANEGRAVLFTVDM